MKIGILTFHNSRNYGAVLQAHALCSVIEELKHRVEIVNYRSVNIENNLKIWSPTRNLLKSILQSIFRYRKKRVFDSFEKNILKITRNAIDKKDINNELNKYDAVIVGSDQVWNGNITTNDEVYFLPNVMGKRIAYAASVGDTIDLSNHVVENIKKFDHVSVRESKLNKALLSYGIESCECCDPTILAGRECFENIVSKPNKKSGYVFVFMIWNSPTLLENARKFAKENGLKVINNKSSLEFFLHCKPEEFLSWIKNSSYVFTNSFHGTVFSLMFHKKFVSSICKNNGEQNLRIKELMTYVGCENNIIFNEKEDVKFINNPDYMVIDKKLQEMQNQSIRYLEKSLNDIVNCQ